MLEARKHQGDSFFLVLFSLLQLETNQSPITKPLEAFLAYVSTKVFSG